MIDIIYMKDCGGFINIKELEEVWDNSYFMKGFKNIEDFVSNEVNLSGSISRYWLVRKQLILWHTATVKLFEIKRLSTLHSDV